MFEEGQFEPKANFPVGMWTTPECAYYELFKEAALDGNSKLEFGAQWQTILAELGAVMNSAGSEFSEEKLRREFEAMDSSGDGSLDADELHEVFRRLGKDLKRGTIANLIRLADDDGNGTIEWPEFARIFRVLDVCGAGETAAAGGPGKGVAPAPDPRLEAGAVVRD